jgi:tRNA(Ile)-lysidine synthetase-like protein
VETILYRLVASGNTKGVKVRREDGVVRPLLEIWREDTVRYCEEQGLDFRNDSSNPSTKRGLIRDEILPLLRQLHPGAEKNLLALADERPRLPRELERTLASLLASTDGTKAADLGHGVRAVREYASVRLEGRVRFGPWQIESPRPGLVVRTRRPGDHLAGRSKKVQDLLVDAKVPRDARDDWPLVVFGDEVVAVPGIAEAPGWEDTVRAWKDPEE